MSCCSRYLFIAAGLIAGIVGTLLLSGPTTSAQAPPAAKAEASRFQISAWANTSGHGAYVLDTQTGEVHSVIGESKPMPVGKAGRPLVGDS